MISQPHIRRRRLISCHRAMKVKTARTLVTRRALAMRLDVLVVVLVVGLVGFGDSPPPRGT